MTVARVVPDPATSPVILSRVDGEGSQPTLTAAILRSFASLRMTVAHVAQTRRFPVILSRVDGERISTDVHWHLEILRFAQDDGCTRCADPATSPVILS